MNALPLDRLVFHTRRFINRHVLGLETNPDLRPPPTDCAAIPIPPGIAEVDDAGSVWILDNEHLSAWHRRRTVIGAQAYRFEANAEYDCGWRLADVAARFVDLRLGDHAPTIVAIVPPTTVYMPVSVVPWLGERLASLLGARFEPDLFEAVCPFHVPPDTIPHPRIPLASMFRLKEIVGGDWAKQRVLVIDWRYYQGRTLSTLARLVRRSDAEVWRLAWLR